jgi:tRNA threonylcarbamoyladenosine biosynthesis protein TsaB
MVPPPKAAANLLILGIDTCGSSGSVALARLIESGASILEETLLEGRTYSATLVAAIDSLLKTHGIRLPEIACLVVANGPGSFTGVRVGLSAAKGLAEGAGLPVVAVSRLAVLAHKAGLANAALDAHRQEIYLRVNGREMLAGAEDLAGIAAPGQVAVCDPGAEALLASAWATSDLVRAGAPTASDAIRLAVPSIAKGDFSDIAILDGHYLRRSDAEIFGEKGRPAQASGSSVP